MKKYREGKGDSRLFALLQSFLLLIALLFIKNGSHNSLSTVIACIVAGTMLFLDLVFIIRMWKRSKGNRRGAQK